MIKKIMFATAKEGFRKLRKEHKSQVRRAAREFKRGKVVIPVEPYDLKKKAFKRSFRNTKFMDKAAYLEEQKTKKLPRGGKRTIVGKAFVKSKLEKASKAHAGQAKALGKVLEKKKLMLGGLLTKGIKLGYKQYRKAGGRKITEIMKSGVRGSGKRSDARKDVRFGIKLHGRQLTKRDKAKLKDYAP